MPSQFLLKRKTFISMLFIGLCLLGIISYRQLPVELFPQAELPFLIVQVNSLRDLDPEYVEKQAIIPLEAAIGTLEDIEKIESYAQRRRGIIFIYYNEATRVKYAYLKLQQKIDAIKPALAEDFLINVFKIDTEQIANMFMNLQVRGSGGVDRIRHIVDQKIINTLENINGIANAEIFGGREKSVEIILDEQACLSHNITPVQIRRAISQNNRSKTFLGTVNEQHKRYFVNLVSDYTDVHELENIVLNPNGPLLLKHVAQVFVGAKEQTSLSRVNSKEAVTIQLIRDSQVNLISLSQDTRKVIANLNQQLNSEDIEIVIQSDTAEDMERNINLIQQLALIGGLLATVILWFFLQNIRLVIIIALAIPISLLTAMNFFYTFGVTINSLTLVGAALAVGMLLDNSIVVLENIYRLHAKGKNQDEAVVRGTTEVWRSIVAATLTTIAIFLPFVFSENFLIKILGKQIGVSIISTLLVSLAVALLLIPITTHKFLNLRRREQLIDFQKNNRLIQIYTVLLKSAMRFPARTIISAIVFFFVGLLLCIALSLNVSNEVELDEFTLYITMPRGATLENTDIVVTEFERKLFDLEEKQDITSQIYEEDAVVTIQLQENYQAIKDRSLSEIKQDIQQRVRRFPGIDVSFDQPQQSERYRGGMERNPGVGFLRMLGIGSQTEKIIIKGSNFSLLKDIADDFLYYLEGMESIDHARVNIAENRPEIHLLFDNQILSFHNIPLINIASELSGFQREISSNINFKQGTDEYDIVIRQSDEQEKTIEDLKELNIHSTSGAAYPLDQVSRIIYASGISNIFRVNQEKQIEITYKFLDEVNNSKELLNLSREQVDRIVSSVEIPPGIAVEVVHDDMDFSEYYFLFAVSFLLIYMILASVFESLLLPVIMMFTIPLAVIGSLWAIILTGNSLLNANTLTGFLILLGVVVNNGIILIDYTRVLRNRNYSLTRALIAAGQTRVRPILITTITTIVAMMPLAMGKAEYVVHIGAPFAITVIGGLTVSTLFTLVFIPTVYIGLETSLNWLKSLRWELKLQQLLLFIAGCVLIYYRIDSLIWRFANLFLLLFAIPGFTYFARSSLRRAKSKMIKHSTINQNKQFLVFQTPKIQHSPK